MVYNPLEMISVGEPSSSNSGRGENFEKKNRETALSVLEEGETSRYVISMEDLLNENLLPFWTDRLTVSAIEETENLLREELTKEDENRKIGKEKADADLTPEIDIERALKEGANGPYYKRSAQLLYGKALKIVNSATEFRGVDREMIAARVVDEFLGLGPIEPLTRDSIITEIMVNAYDKIFFERHGKIEQAKCANFRSPDHTANAATRFLRAINKAVSSTTPLVDGQLADGSRVNVIHPSISDGETVITIRRFPNKTWTLMELVDMGSLPIEMALDIGRIVEGRASLLVVGGTGSGKTTLLNAASGCIPTLERIVTVEDSRELRLHPDAANVIHMQARRGTEKVEEVTMQRLVKNALRMRPDRIIVGETRSAEVIDYLQACSTGHEGSMSTIHANSPQETMTRISLLVAQSGISIQKNDVMDAIGLAIDVIIFAKRFPDGARRITDISEIDYSEENHTVKTVPIWQWDEEAGRHIKRKEFSKRLLIRFNQYAPVPISKERLKEISDSAHKADEERTRKQKEGQA